MNRVVAIVLLDKIYLLADSTATYKVKDLDIRQLQGLLPYAESIEIHWLLENVATNEIDWNIDAYPGWDRDHELSAVACFGTDQTAPGPQMSAITNLLKSQHYMRHLRLQAKWRLHVGVGAPKEARLSAVAYVTLKGT